jgi:serralysin
MRHTLKSTTHSTWYITTSGDSWLVHRKAHLEVYNGDGISDTAAQIKSRIEIAGHVSTLDGEGVDLYGRSATVSVASTGRIETQHGFGIAFEGSAWGGMVENRGIIDCSLGGLGMFGAAAQSGDRFTAVVRNWGDIIGGSYGIDSRVDDLDIVNKAGGLIKGGQYAIGSVNNDVTLVNAGTIKGGAQGAILFNSGNDSVTNSGRIVGNVTLNNGDDTFVNSGGTVSGIVNAGFGNDTYVVDKASLTLREDDFSDIDLVKASIDWTLGDNFENLTLTGRAISATGNADANIITGNARDNRITGLGGDDTLKGAGGADDFVFTPGCGRDTIVDFADGQDVIDLGGYAGIDGFDDIVSITASEKGAVVMLSENGMDTITLKGIGVAVIGAGDFDFAA